MHKLEKHTLEVIEREGLLRRGSPVVVALSGGADSVALLSVLNALGYECIAAHCNFHLRGAESIRDMRHAELIARQLGVNIYIREFNVAERVKNTGESVEMACRELRYTWFHELLDRDYSQAIAVAHHREDNVETFFLNLMRSSGLRGLTGMEFRRGYVIRPFLDVSRDEIEEYLNDVNLEYITDSSNRENHFKRNRLRNVVLPAFEEHFPGSMDSVLSTMSWLKDSRLIVDYALRSLSAEYVTANESVDVAGVITRFDRQTAKAILFELLYDYGFTSTQVDNLLSAVENSRSGLHFELRDGSVAELDRGRLTFPKNEEDIFTGKTYQVSLHHDILNPVHIEVSEHGILEFNPGRDMNVMYIDKRILNDNAVFEIRRPRVGDRMRPYGMNGERLVSDILKDAKYSAAKKRDTWLLTRNGEILWVIGLRASAHFSVTPDTRRYLRLQYNKSRFDNKC